jgi:pimeloyl-ACP methyl ester carboxylesterase
MSNPQNCLSVIAVEPALSTPLNVITLIKKHLHDGVDGFANRESFLRHLQDSRPTLSATWRYRLVEHALCSSPDGRLHYTFDPIVLQLKTRNSHAADPCFTKWLELIETPLLLLRGEASAVLPHADARLIATHVPQCKFATIKQAGHSVIMENPIGVLDQILPFLAELIGSLSPDDCEDIA